MKICFKLVKAGSGSDVWTINLANALKEIGVETSIHYYPHAYQYFPHLLRLREKPITADIIHTNSWNGFAFKRSVPLVVSEHLVVHDDALNAYKSVPQRAFHKMVYGFEKKSFSVADQITSVSDYTKDKLKEVFGLDSVRIYNGVDTKVFCQMKIKEKLPGLDGDKTALLFVGNLSKRKGADLLPAIMKELSGKFVLICATGPRRSIAKISDNIYMAGSLSQEELVSYYNACDIFLFPTRLEGFGLTVSEAMACGKPIVATDCSSMPELVLNEKGGFLCELDNVKEFAEKTRILAESPALMKEMGEFNRERTEKNFSLTQMAVNYYTLYENLLKSDR